MNIEEFGRTADGDTVRRVTISGGGLTAHVLTWGAVVQDLRLAGHEPPLVLGFDRFEDYPVRSPFFGAIAGRYANRIRHGRFDLDGRTVQVDTNFLGKHLLHGGIKGIGKRVWTIAETGPDFVRLTLADRNGEMGFPGNLDIECLYTLEDGALKVALSARTDSPTLCNLAHHSYFNLDDGGAGDVLGHRLTIDGDRYVPVDGEWIPTGGTLDVGGTPFDFRGMREIAWQEDGSQFVYDHNWCLAAGRRPLTKAVRLEGARSGVAMEVWTTEPGVQFYAGHKLAVEGGLGGRNYGAFAGLCLEPQIWPDAPNNADFPQAVLRPGEVYEQATEYRFSK
ncbi:aldose epimerase family protein [Aliihoeflea sp. 2WW]|uniref:aldose epimerase family protein n=1 Tax=Aliihoeflea sp. 2WW TaxID=1381123 RepID=UPI0004652439|nr:aldose epimerase family protein [Aliihoeflea sp. 2WW]